MRRVLLGWMACAQLPSYIVHLKLQQWGEAALVGVVQAAISCPGLLGGLSPLPPHLATKPRATASAQRRQTCTLPWRPRRLLGATGAHLCRLSVTDCRTQLAQPLPCCRSARRRWTCSLSTPRPCCGAAQRMSGWTTWSARLQTRKRWGWHGQQQ